MGNWYLYEVICVPELKLEILDLYVSPDLTLCDNATIVCRLKPFDGAVQWSFSGKNITEDERYKTYFLLFHNVLVFLTVLSVVSVLFKALYLGTKKFQFTP